MSEKEYTLSDGSKVIGPANPDAAAQAWLRAAGGLEKQSMASDVLRATGNKLIKGAISAPFIGGDLFGLGATLMEKLRPGSTTEQNRASQSGQILEAVGYPEYKPETTPGHYAGAAAEAVGGGLILPMAGAKTAISTGVNIGRAPGIAPAITSTIGRAVQTPLLQNAAIGMGAQLGGDVSSKFGEQQENPLMRAAGGVGTALTAALAARIATPKFAGSVSRSLEDMKPADWQTAAKTNADMTAAGATQQTVADLLPETSKLRAVASEMSNAPGSGELYSKLAGRENGEIARLLDEAKTGAQRTAVPNVSPISGAAGTDEMLVEAARSNRTDAMMPHLQNAPRLPKTELNAIVRALRGRAGLEQNAGTVDADFARRAASTIETAPIFGQRVGNTPPSQFAMPNAQGVTDVPTVRGAVLPEGMANAGRGFVPQGAVDVTEIAANNGANIQALSKIIKSLKDRDASVDVNTGKMLQNSAAVTSANQASAELAKRSPGYANAMDAYKANSPQVDIATILAEKKLYPMPSKARASLQDVNAREEIASLLSRLDPTQAQMFTGKLNAADRLSMMKPQQGAEGMQQELRQGTVVGTVAQPFGTAARKAGMASQIQGNEQLARLIANPTPENMKILADLGRNNPDLARKIRELSNVGAVNASINGGE